jgi:hypothetical protein
MKRLKGALRISYGLPPAYLWQAYRRSAPAFIVRNTYGWSGPRVKSAQLPALSPWRSTRAPPCSPSPRRAFACGISTNTLEPATLVRSIGVPQHFTLEKAVVPATESFPVQVKIYKNGELAATCKGQSNQPAAPFDCDRVISMY